MAKATEKPQQGRVQQDLRKREIENPYFQRAHREGATNPRKIKAHINVKESAIETLYARRALGHAQKMAADRFRALVEAAGGSAKSLDYSMDRVDGGVRDPVTSKLSALQELKRCRYRLGQRGYDILYAICAEGKSLDAIDPNKRSRLTLADNLRADLDDLASIWGLKTKPRLIA